MDNKTAMKTAAFVVVVGAVLGTFAFLGTQTAPPNMPAGPQHTLRFSLKGELIGVESDPPVDPLKAATEVYELPVVEDRINVGCQACHGGPPEQPKTVACGTNGAPCLPEHHPAARKPRNAGGQPRSDCIKCHRSGPSAK